MSTPIDAFDVNVTDAAFGADPTGTADSTAAFNAALATVPPTKGAGIRVYVPAGYYKVSGQINITKPNTTLVGAGSNTTTIAMTGNATAPVIQVLSTIPFTPSTPGDLTRVTIGGLTLERTVQAGAGGDGVIVGQTDPSGSWVGYITQALLYDVICQHQWRGFLLGSTSFGLVRTCQAANCQNDGFQLVNAQNKTGFPSEAPLAASLQWLLNTTISQLNAANGYHVIGQAVTGLAAGNPITFFPWSNIVSFANNFQGLYIQGASSAPLGGFDMIDANFGGDNANEVYINSYSGQMRILGGSFSLAGNGPSGPLNYYLGGPPVTQAPATYNGSGIFFDNSTQIMVQDSLVIGNSLDGIAVTNSGGSPVESLITGCVVLENNAKYPAGSTTPVPTGSFVGIAVTSGYTTITGCRVGNAIGSALQYDGISLGSGVTALVVGCDLRGNTHDPVNPPTAVTSGSPAGSFNLT